MLAIIRTGGKQYKVSTGQKIKIEKLEKEVGDVVTFEVLFTGDESSVSVGAPVLDKAVVEGKVIAQDRHDKVKGIKHKAKKPYMLVSRLTIHDPAARLALAVIQQAIQDSNWQEPLTVFALGSRGGASQHTLTTVEDGRYIARTMRADAREWLQSGEWQRTTDQIGIGRQAIIQYLIHHCEWYKL